MTYLASPYSHPDPAVRLRRYEEAAQACAKLCKSLHVFSPIVHWHQIAQDHVLPTDAARWWDYNRSMLRRCDSLIILKLPGWEKSQGVILERNLAAQLGLPTILKTLDDL